MTIINRNQLKAAFQPEQAERALLTLVVDKSLQKFGLNFPVVSMPFVREEVATIKGSFTALSNVCYTLDSDEATFASIEKLLIEVGISHNVVSVEVIGGNVDETFYQVKLNIEAMEVAA
mgnify:FL=1